MMRAKHAAAPRGRKGTARATRILVALLVVVSMLSVGATMAWYAGESSLVNPFSKGKVSVAVDETFDAQVGKQDVSVSVPANAGAVAAYVRARVDIYWEDSQGRRIWDAPVSKADDPAAYDYEIVWTVFGQAGAPQVWVKGADGLYYWTSAVAPGSATAPLIQRCVQTVRYDDGRTLVVDVATQAIQSEPARAFDEAWGAAAKLAVGQDGTVGAAASAGGGAA